MGHDLSVRPLFFVLCLVSSRTGFYVGFIVWGRSPVLPKATSFPAGSGGKPPPPPGNFLKWICPEMQSGAFWDTILRNFTVECYLYFSRDHVPYHIASFDREYLLHVHRPRCVWMIFPIYLLIYCNDNNIFGWEAEHFFEGGSFYPSNTLDRTPER